MVATIRVHVATDGVYVLLCLLKTSFTRPYGRYVIDTGAPLGHPCT